MKQFLLFSLVLFCFFADAQVGRNNLQFNYSTGINFKNLGSRERLFVPLDTLNTGGDSAYLAFYHGRWYGRGSVKWVDLGALKIDDSTYLIAGDTVTVGTNSGGGAGAGVTQVNTGYGLGGGPITGTGTILVDSAALTGLLLRRKDSTLYWPKYRADTSILAIYNALAGKQGTLTLTTTGSSGPSTLISNTLNIPQYSGGIGGTDTADIAGSGVLITRGAVNRTFKADTSVLSTQYDLTQITAIGATGGDLSGNYPNPRLAHTVSGTGGFVQIKNNVVIGDTIVPLGQIFTDNFARGSLGGNYGTSGSQTISFPSSAYLQIAGGLDYDNNIYRTDFTAVNRWVDSVWFTTGTVTGSSYGLDINFYDPVNFRAGLIVQFGTATGITKIYFRYYDGTTQTQLETSLDALTLSAGDSLLAILKRYDNFFTCTYKNLTTGAPAVTLPYIFPTNNVSFAAPASGRMAIGSLGGTQNVSKWSHTSDEVKYQVAIAANSIGAGGYSADVIENSWPNLIFSSRQQWARLGGSGDRSSDAVSYIPQLLAIQPRILLYALGVNDALNSVSGSDYSTNVRRVLDSCIAHNITPILIDLPPDNNALTKPYSDTLRAIKTRYGIGMIDGIYDALRTGTAYNATYSDDGIHPNNPGHILFANIVRPQLPSVNYTVKMLNLPFDSTGQDRDVVMDTDGNLKKSIFANRKQRIGDKIRVGDQMLLPTADAPAISAQANVSNGFVNIIKNGASNAWSGTLYKNSTDEVVNVEGWANSATAIGNGSQPDSTYIHKIFGRATGRYAWYAGDNGVTANFADLIVYKGSILPGSHVASGRTVNPQAGMMYYDTDSSGYVYYDGTVWKKIVSPGATRDRATLMDKNTTSSVSPGASFDEALVRCASGSTNITLTLTANSNYQKFVIKRTDGGTAIITIGTSSGNIEGASTVTISAIQTCAIIEYDGANYWVISKL